MGPQQSIAHMARLWTSRALLAALCVLSDNAAAATYNVIDLATLEPGAVTVVRGSNGAGMAVGGGRLGASGVPGRQLGLLFETPASPRQIVGLPDSDATTVFGLNDAGTLVGSANAPTALRAFATTPSGAARELRPLPGDNVSAAQSINNAGRAAGFSSGPAGERAVTWDAAGNPTALPALPDMTGSRAIGINLRGDAVGIIGTAAGPRPVLWPSGAPGRVLPLLPGHVQGEAYAINARGDAVGYSADAAGTRRATHWPAAGGVVDLGTLADGSFSQALDLNDAGDIVGTSSSAAGERAFLWSRPAGMQDLNTLIDPAGFVLAKAVGINSAGVIVATGYDPGADGHAHTHGGPGGHVDAHELPVRVFRLVRGGP